ncbi:MAG: DUF333 domain-containing protein [Candidatus Moranbacteria bacterium]|nr:DUF333 domain-containing protein [Candidatus Moranbacteria bacterium]
MNQKIRIEIAVGFIAALAILLGIYFWNNASQISTGAPTTSNIVTKPVQKMCTQEAKSCDDGSYVSRTGPNCEFAACPSTDASADIEKSRIANPASINCTQEGGQLEIRTGNDGGQVGFCKFSDGSECEEWQFFQGECKSGNKIAVEFPLVNAEISSPIYVSGRARGTWFFEGSFPVEVYDSNNKLLGSSTISFAPKSADDTWMTENFVNFSGSVKFSQPTTASGYLLLKKDNPSGNSATDEALRLNVKFKK